ncbi:hypothetical protein LTR28_013158, partial [Elasticomyces elasticus]
MGKSKRRKLEEKRGAPKTRPATKSHGISKPTKPQSKSQQHKTQEPTIPFAPDDRILLIGEGYITELLEEAQEVLYEVNATKLSQKEIRKGQRWDRIVFNFPH